MTILRSLLLVILFVTAHSAAAGEAPAPSPSASEFIRTSCEATRYPDICYKSLSRYASAVQQDPARLAVAAIGVSLSRVGRTAEYLAKLSHLSDFGADPGAGAAVRDCLSVYGDAVDQIQDSLGQMRRLTGRGEALRFQISNVQTWMSAALTDQGTCVDGFEEVADAADAAVKSEVRDRTVGVTEVTSIALALVNGFRREIFAH